MPNLPGGPVWQRDASHSTVLDYHLSMLHDVARMDSFRRAIDAVVQPGDVVVDIAGLHRGFDGTPEGVHPGRVVQHAQVVVEHGGVGAVALPGETSGQVRHGRRR